MTVERVCALLGFLFLSGCRLDLKYMGRDLGLSGDLGAADMGVSDGDGVGDMAQPSSDLATPPMCGASGQPCCGGVGGTCSKDNACTGSICQAANVWAIGDRAISLACQSWHWDGNSWHNVTNPLTSNCSLVSAWGSGPSDIWAVGGSGTNFEDALIQHYSASGWSVCSAGQPCAPPAGIGSLNWIFGLSDRDIWAVGKGTAIHWNGSGWTQNNGAIAASDTLASVWCDQSTATCWAVGYGPKEWRFNRTTWEAPTAVGGLYMFAVFGFSANDVWAGGGDFGSTTIIHYDGSTWSAPYSITKIGATDKIRQIWGGAPNDVWAVGDKGTVLHWNGMTWSQVSVPVSSTDSLSIWGRSTKDVYIGGYGYMFHWNGDTWSSVQLLDPSGVTFRSFWAP